jgi:hypothetical protein
MPDNQITSFIQNMKISGGQKFDMDKTGHEIKSNK